MKLTLRPDVTVADTPNGAVLLDGRTGRYWQLNPTGTQVLRYLLDGLGQESAAEQLAEQHAITREQATADVATLITQLRESKVVRK